MASSACQRLLVTPAKLGVGLDALELGARLVKLLVDLRRFDLGEELALYYVGADVEVPLLQVAVGAGVDGRVGEGLHVAGKDDVLRASSRQRDG